MCRELRTSRPRPAVGVQPGWPTEALAFYDRLVEFELRGRSGRMAFIDIGDQFIALAEGRAQPPDDHRHFGLVVDDKEGARASLVEAGVEVAEQELAEKGLG